MTIVQRERTGSPRILLAPHQPRATMRAAIEEAGGTIVDRPELAEALIWLDPRNPSELPTLLAAGTGIRWVQLPFAGIEPFVEHLTPDRVWTSGKGVYAEPVAEMILGMLLATMRHLVGYARASEWSAPEGRNLFGSHVVVLGGGEITSALLPLLVPFRCRTTVLRRLSEPFAGADLTGSLADLIALAPTADAVVIALALTPETHHVIDRHVLAALPEHAVIVNVGRGGHIDTDALTESLRRGDLGAAALDVTDPEPLPPGHPLWTESRCLITPHVGNTPDMGRPLLEARIGQNVRRFADGAPLLGVVDVAAGY